MAKFTVIVAVPCWVEYEYTVDALNKEIAIDYVQDNSLTLDQGAPHIGDIIDHFECEYTAKELTP